MRRKLCCMVIVLALMLHLLPQPMLASALDAGSGVEALSVSEAGIEWIKEFEGFSGTAYESGGQWYIGYGMGCAPEDYPNGITEEEADALLREKLASCSDTLNAWLESIDFSASQTQFDALASFTYSFGDVWMRMDCQLAQLLKAGGADATDIAFVNAFGIWCHENKTILPPLITRRLAEACLFLYGDYSGGRSDDFSYLTLDTDGGNVERDIVFYEKAGRMASCRRLKRMDPSSPAGRTRPAPYSRRMPSPGRLWHSPPSGHRRRRGSTPIPI